MAGARADEPMKKVGKLIPNINSNNSHQQFFVLGSHAKVKVSVSGKETFAQSSTPDAWHIDKGRLFQAYGFKELHGIKVRFTSYNVQQQLEPDIHIYNDGLLFKVSRQFLKPILTATDQSKKAEIRGKDLWFDGEKVGELPEDGVPGKWYSDTPDLEVILADNFHDDLILDLGEASEGTFSEWRGNELQLRLYGNASLTVGDLSLKDCWIHSDTSSVIVQSLNCEKLDASAQSKGVITIKSGHIKKLATSELFGGKVNVLAEVDKPDGTSIGLTNSQKVIKKETPQGTTIKFPNYGNFDLK
jgi:hypothetical protein